jgi:hypothetical protein
MQTADPAARGRYAHLIAQCLQPTPVFQPVREDDRSVQVERGLMVAAALREHPDLARIEDACRRLLESGAAELRVVDAGGHQRTHYRGLLVYVWRRTLAKVESFLTPAQASGWAAGIEPWLPLLRRVEDPVGRAWAALALEDPDFASPFDRLVDQQQASGALLRADQSQNPETLWYDELVLLHALTAYAVRAGKAETQEHLRAAEYHLNETQPDHATSEPWGLLAFILTPTTHSVADQMLHTVRVLHPKGATGVTAILLADVLDCLRELDRPSR